MCTGPKKNFLVPVKDLLPISSTLFLNYCLTTRFVEKCLLFLPVCFKIFHRFSLSNNLTNITTGTSLVPVPVSVVVPVDPEAIFSGYDNHSVFTIVLFCRENISLRNIVFENLVRFQATKIFLILLPGPELVLHISKTDIF